MLFTASGWCSATQAGMKNEAGISAWRSRSRMRGSASTTPKVPCERVTGSLTPRASQRVSASRSKLNAQAARLPCGQRGAVIGELTLRARLRSRRAVPCNGEAQREPAVHLALERGLGADQPDRPYRPEPLAVS